MARIFGATTSLFFSFVLGGIAFALVAVQYPAGMETIFDAAGWLTDSITDAGIPTQYNVWVRFLINETQLTLFGFVIATRVVLSTLWLIVKAPFDR